MQKYICTQNFYESTVNEQPALLPTEGTGNTEVLYVNDTGIDIFRFLKDAKTKEELDTYIIELYNCNDESVSIDNQEYLDLLISKGVIKTI